jgi:hypothetical protein
MIQSQNLNLAFRRQNPALFSLVILLCGFPITATAEDDNKKTILLKDAGVIRRADDVPQQKLALPAIRIQRALNNPNPAPDFLKPLINLELSFVKRVCDPTDEQMTAIIAAAKEAHEAMANILTDQRQAFENRGIQREIFMGPNNQRMNVNPFKRVREDVAKLLKPLVSEQQYASYTEEANSRDEYERAAAVDTLLEMLDAKLLLSPDQQTQLHEKMSTSDTLPDLHTLIVYSSNTQYLPQLPDQLITPILSATQKQIWSSLNRVSIHQNLSQGNPTGFTEDWLK